MDEINIARFAGEAQDLLRAGRTALGGHDLTRSLTDGIPDGLDDASTPKLVFCGQYSAGKSSLIKLLTGQDVATGAGITTDDVRAYRWNGVEIIDTPGIHTSVREDHDEKSYAAIGRADIVVFVITDGLMDSTIAAAFREIAYTRQRADAMLLVVNKMSRAAKGNTAESQQQARKGLTEVLLPRSVDTFPMVFTDAEDGLRARDRKEPERAERDLKRSNVAALVRVLNEMAAAASLSSKLRQPLFVLEAALSEGLAKLGSDDSDESRLEGLMIERRKRIVEGRVEARQAGRTRIRGAAAAIREQGHRVAAGVGVGRTGEQINSDVAQGLKKVDEIVERLPASIAEVVDPISDNLAKLLDGRVQSPEVRAVISRFQSTAADLLRDIHIDPKTLQRVNTGADLAKKFGNFLVTNSIREGAFTARGVLSFRAYSGTATHGAVKAIGASVGYKFAPFEAIKLTRNIATFGKVIGAAGVVVGVISQIKEDVDEGRNEVAERDLRGDIVGHFDATARIIETHFDEKTGEYVAKNFFLEDLDAQIETLRQSKQNKSDGYEAISKLLARSRDLLRRSSEDTVGAIPG
jgi:small GTP-binding protein